MSHILGRPLSYYGVPVGASGSVRLSGFVSAGRVVAVPGFSGGPGGRGVTVAVIAEVGVTGAVGRTVSGNAVGAGVG